MLLYIYIYIHYIYIYMYSYTFMCLFVSWNRGIKRIPGAWCTLGGGLALVQARLWVDGKSKNPISSAASCEMSIPEGDPRPLEDGDRYVRGIHIQMIQFISDDLKERAGSLSSFGPFIVIHAYEGTNQPSKVPLSRLPALLPLSALLVFKGDVSTRQRKAVCPSSR